MAGTEEEEERRSRMIGGRRSDVEGLRADVGVCDAERKKLSVVS